MSSASSIKNKSFLTQQNAKTKYLINKNPKFFICLTIFSLLIHLIAAVPQFADFTSSSCGDNLVSPASKSGMPESLNQGAISTRNSIAAPVAQPSTEGNRGYATHITLVPLHVINEMCRLLDLDRDILDGNDYTRLGSELGLDSTTILNLKQKFNSPSFVILMKVFSTLPNSGTLKHLIPLLEKMGRYDVIDVIKRWVGSQ